MDELSLLYQALSSPIGICIRVWGDMTLATQRLYAARRKAGDFNLDVLQVRKSPFNPSEELWLVKGSPKPPKETPSAQG